MTQFRRLQRSDAGGPETLSAATLRAEGTTPYAEDWKKETANARRCTSMHAKKRERNRHALALALALADPSLALRAGEVVPRR